MYKRLLFFFVVIIINIFFFKNVYGGNVYYLSYDENENEIIACDRFEFYGQFTQEEKASVIFEILFSGNYYFTPKGTEVIEVCINNGTLTLNVSGGIQSYGGGNGYERRLIFQIIKTALDIPGVKRVTLLIEGFSDYLPEGSLIFEESLLPEL